MKTDISPETYDLLKASGWSPDRAVDIDPIVSILEDHHYTVYPAVKAFLREFHGIKIAHRNPRRKGDYHLIFDPAEGFDHRYFNKYYSQLQYERDVSGSTCPLGISHDYEQLVYYMDREGRVYEADYHGGFGLVGENGLLAIEWVLNDRPQGVEYVIAPWNDYRIYDILTNSKVFATVGHTNSEWVHKYDHGGYDVDRFLRDKGYEVYTVQPHPETIEDTVDDDITLLPTLDDVPKPVEILVCISFGHMEQAIKDAERLNISIIFPAYSSSQPQHINPALAAGIEYIESIGIQKAYERVIAGNLFKSE